MVEMCPIVMENVRNLHIRWLTGPGVLNMNLTKGTDDHILPLGDWFTFPFFLSLFLFSFLFTYLFLYLCLSPLLSRLPRRCVVIFARIIKSSSSFLLSTSFRLVCSFSFSFPQLENGTPNLTLSYELGGKWVSEKNGWATQTGGSKWAVRATERAARGKEVEVDGR